MKEFLKKLIAAKEKRANELRELIKTAGTADEVRSLGATLDAVLAELQEAKDQLAGLEEDAPAEGEEGRGFNPMGQFQVRNVTTNNTDTLSTIEYRTAFKNFVQRGVTSTALNVGYTKRADEEHVSSDLGLLLPNTIVNELIKGIEEVWGTLYSKVKHTNVKGGVQYLTGDFEAKVYWNGTAGDDTEHGVSETQKTGDVKPYIVLSYHIGEIRIAQSLLQSILTVDAFEKEVVNALLEAYVKDADIKILEGTGNGQPTVIFANVADGIQRIPAKNIIEFTADEMADWTSWKKKLFSKIPLSMRKLSPEFVMTANTFEANIETLVDSDGRPVARELTNPVNGDVTCRFYGKEVSLVEEGASIKNFDEAAAGEYFGIYWVPGKAYIINTNLQFGYKRYFDENTNKWVNKALFIYDGKILDPKYIYLLKKKA